MQWFFVIKAYSKQEEVQRLIILRRSETWDSFFEQKHPHAFISFPIFCALLRPHGVDLRNKHHARAYPARIHRTFQRRDIL